MKTIYTPIGWVALWLFLVPMTLSAQDSLPEAKVVRFTSVPDIFNWNIDNPTLGWEDTLDWFFHLLKVEGPDFTLVAGDIMDARWYKPDLIKRKTEQYWTGYVKRFKDKGITLYVAPGDHEYGDDRGLTMGNVSRLFGEQFSLIMGMPKNGPENHLGRAFYVRRNNLLIITLDTFEDVGDRFAYTVGEEQLAWMKQVLVDNKDAEFIIVQGHLPIVGPVRSKNSSASMLKGSTDSALWKLMVEYGVDAYLCGEHHRITVHHHDGIWQIVHGALWGTQTDLNFMRGESRTGQLTLELFEFDVEYSGGYISDHPHRSPKSRPREQVSLTAETKVNGPRVTGKLTLKVNANGDKEASQTEGWFANPAKAKQR